MSLRTADAARAVEPEDLANVLESLRDRQVILGYEMGPETTTVRMVRKMALVLSTMFEDVKE
jgi:hypothetical protein